MAERELALVLLEEREVDHPQVGEVGVPPGPPQVVAQATQDRQRRLPAVGGEEEHVAGAGLQEPAEPVLLLSGEELGDGRAEAAVVLHLDPHQTPGAQVLGTLHQAVGLGPGEGAGAGVDRPDRAPRLQAGGEHAELGGGEQARDVHDLHPEADVGLVGPIPLHGLVPGEAWEGGGDLLAPQLPGGRRQGRLDGGLHVLGGPEGALQVELGELQLTIGAEVLVPVAAGDLEVALDAGDHKQLLEELRRLGQSVEVARAQA